MTAILAWVAKILFLRKNKKIREEDSDAQNFYVY